jgi:hypothetical protein
MKRTEITILTVAVALIMGGLGLGLGFGVGRATAPKATVSSSSAAGGGTGQGGFGAAGGRRFGGRPVLGTVATISGTTLTVTLQDGSTKTVTLTGTTTYTNGDGSSASVAGVTAGVTVAAFGTAASDGSITATRIIINPPARSGAPASGAQTN